MESEAVLKAAVVLDTPEEINSYILLTLRARLKLEIKGMTCKPPSALTQLQKRGYHSRTRESMLAELTSDLVKKGIIRLDGTSNQ